MIENFDAIFYYDKEKFNEQVAKEVGFEEGKTAGIEIGKSKGIEIGKSEGIEIGKSEGIEIGKSKGIEIGKNVGMVIGKKETILKMLNSGMPELDILKYLGITKSDLEEIKKCK